MFPELKAFAELAAWLAGDGLLVLACLAVGFYIREWRATALALAAGLALSGFFLTKGAVLEHAAQRAAQEAREQNVQRKGVEARASAEHSVASDAATGRVLPDRYDRAQRQQR